MIGKSHILILMLLVGFALCFTNGFADERDVFARQIREDKGFVLEDNFEYPTAEGAAYIQGNAEYQRDPDIIIGTPDFEKMRDLPPNSPDYILGTKVAHIRIPQRNNPDRVWICTGFLVGPDLFMTNHHCIHDDFGLLPLESARIYMDYYQDRDVDPTRGGVTASVSELLQADALKDYALLKLDKPIGNTYGWLELDTTTVVDTSQSVKLISHNGGRSKEIVRRNSQIVDIRAGHALADSPFVLAYLADSEGGSSGSPVFLREGTGVIAIHHSGWTRFGVPEFNVGSLMSHIVPEIAQWLPGSTAPELVVEVPQVSNGWLLPGESFTLSATVRNQGGVASSATTLRFYQSFDNIITTSDTEIGTAVVGSLSPTGTRTASLTLTAPAFLGTYYYGVCVDAVADENRTDNNCSAALTLTVSTSPPAHMYWTIDDPAKIQRATLNGSNVEDLVTTGLSLPAGITVDAAGGKMYWTDWGRDKIQRANLDGSNIENLVTTGLNNPWNIAVDTAGGKMYWTMGSIGVSDGEIQRANLDGTNVQTLITGLYWPRYITLDAAGGKVYWTISDLGASTIQRANLDGSNVEDLVTTGLSLPGGITVDAAGGKMYWTDWGGSEKIQRANLDGSNVEDLVTTGLNNPWGIAVDTAGGKMYWTMGSIGGDDGEIQRANLDGTNVQTLITGLHWPQYIAIGMPQTSRAIITFSPSEIPDQTFTVDSPIEPLALPIVSGGTEPYTYTLEPLPADLFFDAGAQVLRGVPTTLGSTVTTYTATDATGASASLTFTITIEDDGLNLDVNGDGKVDVLDLVWVAVSYQMRGDGLPADVNADGVVNVQDLVAVAEGIDAADVLPSKVAEEVALAAEAAAAKLEGVAGAPGMGLSSRSEGVSGDTAYRNIAAALADTRTLAGGDARLGKYRPLLEGLLHLLAETKAIPETTALLPNYPNPFNPETWIPYHLAKDAEVVLRIYDVRGVLVRELMLGHQPAGVYESRGRAAYWDGKNQSGEKVASGLYFYTLFTESTRDSVTAGEFNATRKLLIAK